MNLKNKWYLGFTITYWVIIVAGIIIFSLGFEKVPINSYGLKRNLFDSRIEQEDYVSGLYFKNVGFYFVNFPASKRYLEDISLNVTNKDMQTVQVKYTLVYRLLPGKIYSLYFQLSQDYESRIIAIVNSIVSNYFTKLSQKNTRVSAQNFIVQQIKTQFGNKIPILQECVQIEAFWLNELDFYEGEADYRQAFKYSSSYSEAYEEINIKLQKVTLQVETLKNLLHTKKQELKIITESKISEGFVNQSKEAQFKVSSKKYFLSQTASASQIFEYYQPPRLIFK